MTIRRQGRPHGAPACLLLVALLTPARSAANDDAAMSRIVPETRELQGPVLVEATAYNSVVGQTEGDPKIGAWGDRLVAGIKALAVSNDLFEMGMTRGARVRIEGLSGEFLVLDRMPSQWRRRIDIHMGDDVEIAKEWGRREVRIYWQAP